MDDSFCRNLSAERHKITMNHSIMLFGRCLKSVCVGRHIIETAVAMAGGQFSMG